MSSSLLIGKNKNLQEAADNSGEFNELFDCSFNLLITHQYADAYKLLTKAAKLQKHAAVLFNLALCCMAANDNAAALQHTEEASRLLKQNSSLQSGSVDGIEKSLISIQAQSNSYLQPMERRYLQLFAEQLEERVLRLRVDIYLQLKMWPKLTELCLRLQAKNYPNVTEALQIASKANPIT